VERESEGGRKGRGWGDQERERERGADAHAYFHKFTSVPNQRRERQAPESMIPVILDPKGGGRPRVDVSAKLRSEQKRFAHGASNCPK
jgi:hypothetical protein